GDRIRMGHRAPPRQARGIQVRHVPGPAVLVRDPAREAAILAPERDVLARLEIGEAAPRLRQEAEDAQGLREASPGSNDPTLQLTKAPPEPDSPGLSQRGDLPPPATTLLLIVATVKVLAPSPSARNR